EATSEFEAGSFVDGDPITRALDDAMEDIADTRRHIRDPVQEHSGAEASAKGHREPTQAIETETSAALEDLMLDAWDAEDADEFFAQVLSGIHRIAQAVARAAESAESVPSTFSRAAGPADCVGQTAPRVVRAGGRESPRPASPIARLLRQMLPVLQQYAVQRSE